MIEALIILALAGTIETEHDACGAYTIEYVRGDQWPFNSPSAGPKPAVAKQFADGSRAIFINTDGDLYYLDEWKNHERSHLAVWCEHGIKVPLHGREFRQDCRKRVTRRKGYFCRGYFE